MLTLDTLRDQLQYLVDEAEALRVVLPLSPETLVRERPRPDQYAVVEVLQAIAWLDVHHRLPALQGATDFPPLPDAFPLNLPYDTLISSVVEARSTLLKALPSAASAELTHYLWRITQDDAEMLRHTGSFLLDAQRIG